MARSCLVRASERRNEGSRKTKKQPERHAVFSFIFRIALISKEKKNREKKKIRKKLN
jgi:hypothetical protein